MGKEKEIWRDYSRVEKVGYSIYIILLTLFIIGIIYWGYVSGEPHRIIEDNNILYLLLVGIGLYRFSIFYYRIVEYLFCPETEKEIETKQKKKHYKKKYPLKIAFMKIDILDKQLAIKRREKEINKLENKVKDWDNSKWQ